MFTYLILEIVSAAVGAAALLLIVLHILRHKPLRDVFLHAGFYVPVMVLVIAVFGGLIANRTYPPNFAMPPFEPIFFIIFIIS